MSVSDEARSEALRQPALPKRRRGRTAVPAVKAGKRPACRLPLVLSALLLPLFFLPQPARAILDGNGNGISDIVEKAWNGGAMPATPYDPLANPDGDLWDNATEAIAGTNPFSGLPANNGFVTPAVEIIPATYTSTGGTTVVATPETLLLTWPAVSGKAYQVEFSSALSPGTWTPVSDPMVAQGTTMGKAITLTQEDGSAPDRLFFRLTITDNDSENDGLGDSEEYAIGTDPLKPDSDNDGVRDGDELAVYHTNPLSAADLDGDGIPDDLEKCLAYQFLSLHPESEYWGSHHAGLLSGDLDPSYHYTGDGVPIASLVPEIKAVAGISSASNCQVLSEEQIRWVSLYGFPEADPDYNPKGWLSYGTGPDSEEREEITEVANLAPAYLAQRLSGIAFTPVGRAALNATDGTFLLSGGNGGGIATFDFQATSSGRCDGWFQERRARPIANRYDHDPVSWPYLKLTYRAEAFLWAVLWPYELLSVEPLDISLPSGRLRTAWITSPPPPVAEGTSTFVQFHPVKFVSDLNNDGVIDNQDHTLRAKAAASGASTEDTARATEYMFSNDTLSNGVWDKEDADPAKPATADDDDDVEELQISIPMMDGEVWLEHPAITALSFYSGKQCEPDQKLAISAGAKLTTSYSVGPNMLPNTIFARADGPIACPEDNPQIEGDLVLKIKAAGKEVEAARMKLTVVKQLGAEKYFQASRDYIFERNSKLCVRKEAVGNPKDPSYKRIVTMLHEKTVMNSVDAFHRNVKLYGIDSVAGSFQSYDLAINGNFCFSSDPRWWSSSRPAKNSMTDRCHGYLITSGTVQACSSTGGTNVYESSVADYIGWNSAGGLEVRTGIVPVAPMVYSEALGGFGSNLTVEGGWHPWYGLANAGDKKVFFTATPFTVDGNGAGGGVDLKKRLQNSGCPPLPGGNAGEIQCIYGDGGSSLALAYKIGAGPLATKLKGSKHSHSSGILPQQGDYYINTYLLFKSTNPR